MVAALVVCNWLFTERERERNKEKEIENIAVERVKQFIRGSGTLM